MTATLSNRVIEAWRAVAKSLGDHELIRELQNTRPYDSNVDAALLHHAARVAAEKSAIDDNPRYPGAAARAANLASRLLVDIQRADSGSPPFGNFIVDPSTGRAI